MTVGLLRRVVSLPPDDSATLCKNELRISQRLTQRLSQRSMQNLT
jgi:hypothetical protein